MDFEFSCILKGSSIEFFQEVKEKYKSFNSMNLKSIVRILKKELKKQNIKIDFEDEIFDKERSEIGLYNGWVCVITKFKGEHKISSPVKLTSTTKKILYDSELIIKQVTESFKNAAELSDEKLNDLTTKNYPLLYDEVILVEV
jgi:hypothetical protein